ncbi:MAG: putative Ig domain-containing protein [Spirochaetota bacterium]
MKYFKAFTKGNLIASLSVLIFLSCVPKSPNMEILGFFSLFESTTSAPSALNYENSPYTFSQNTDIGTITPNYTGSITDCSCSPTLPDGLVLDTSTCTLSGTPTTLQDAGTYTITANNSSGSTTAEISITISADPPSDLTYSGSPYSYTNGTAISTATPSYSGSISSCSVSPSLPTGLSLSSTCALSGTPTADQSTTDYTITASNAYGSTTATINITVSSVPPSSLTYSGSPYTYTKDAAIATNTPTVSGDVTSCAASPTLPTGLTIDSTTCAISGTPTATQSAATYTITASNSYGSTTTTISITIDSVPPSSLTYSGSPYTYTKTTAITTNTPTFSGSVTSCTASPTLPTGLSIDSTTCAISGTPTATQSATDHTITAANSYGSTTATINITVNGIPPSSLTYTGSPYSYDNGTAISSVTPSYSGTVTSCAASPTLPTGLSLSSTCVLSGTPTADQSATDHTITASNSYGSTTATINITVSSTPPSSLSYSGSPYTYVKDAAITTATPTVSGTVTSCSASPTLPSGLSIDSTTCAISGTPTATQAATTHTITASNTHGSTTADIVVTVNTFYSSSTFAFKQNSAITTISPTGATSITACSSSPTLPTGLSLSSTCDISGTPTVISTSTSYTITPTMTGGPSSVTLTIAVQATLYKIFVTASKHTGDLKTNGSGSDGPAGADSLCNADTNKPDSSSYKALVVASGSRIACTSSDCTDASQNIDWVMKANSIYVRSSDSAYLFITNDAGIFDYGTASNPFDSGIQKQYWTGMSYSGWPGYGNWVVYDDSAGNCTKWAVTSGEGKVGYSDQTDYTSIRTRDVSPSCSESRYLLCVEQ